MKPEQRPTQAHVGPVPTDPMQALLELRERMQALHAQLEYAKLLLRLNARP